MQNSPASPKGQASTLVLELKTWKSIPGCTGIRFKMRSRVTQNLDIYNSNNGTENINLFQMCVLGKLYMETDNLT